MGSKAGENCMNTGCCQVSGHKCFTKGAGRAQCNETCTTGKMGFTCDIVAPHSVPVASPLGQNLYCFSVYTENTGNATLQNHELELLNLAAGRTAGIFACEQWDVFSDVSAPINTNGYVTIKVEDTNNEFHQLKRKDSGTWVNWAIFYQVWLKVREVAKWQAADYTIKVDADAVFAPQRLRTWLSTKPGELPQCPARFFRSPRDHDTHCGASTDTVSGELLCGVRPVRQRRLRLEVWPMGRGRLCPEVHGPPLCGQG